MNIKWTSVLWTLILVLFGLVLILYAESNPLQTGFNVRAAASTVGTVFVVGSVTSFFLDNIARRKFFDEVFEKVVSASDISKTGVIGAFRNSADIDYRPELRNAKEIVVHFTYSTTFLKRYRSEIDKRIKAGANVKLIFLDPKSPLQDFLTEKGWQQAAREASWEIIENFEVVNNKNKNVSVSYVNAIPRYSAIVIDNAVYVIEHTLSSGRTNVPAMKYARNSEFGEFYINDIHKAIDESNNNKANS